jgi:hypothetical protein
MALPPLCQHAIEPVRLGRSMHLPAHPGNTSKIPLTVFLARFDVLAFYGVSWGTHVPAKKTGNE